MEINGETLASFRVQNSGGLGFFAARMDADQVLERRSYMRQVLRNYPAWMNRTNDELDGMRLYRLGDSYVVEDGEGYEYYMPAAGVTQRESDFRRERAMMPFEFMGLTGKDFDWTSYRADITAPRKLVNQYIMNYAKFRKNGMGLYICSGTKGSGKTMLS